MLKTIITEDKQVLVVCGTYVKTKNTGWDLKRGGGYVYLSRYVYHSRKRRGHMNLEINYLERGVV